MPQDFIEETAEFQVGIDDAARRRRMRMGTRDQTIVAGEVEDVPVREAILCYCQCMQITLQASVKATCLNRLMNRLNYHTVVAMLGLSCLNCHCMQMHCQSQTAQAACCKHGGAVSE